MIEAIQTYYAGFVIVFVCLAMFDLSERMALSLAAAV
jgi:hypothetical protein